MTAGKWRTAALMVGIVAAAAQTSFGQGRTYEYQTAGAAAQTAGSALANYTYVQDDNFRLTAEEIQPQPASEYYDGASSEYYDESCPLGGCDGGCSLCGPGGCDCGSCLGGSLMCSPVRLFIGAEYIYARASFSEALAYVVQDPGESDTYVEYDFDYRSSYSFYGGFRWCECGGAIVFDYDRYRSEASFDVQELGSTSILGPYETNPGPNGFLEGSADVDLQSYDLAWEKTIPLGGCLGCCDPCGCGDQCGCGSGCGMGCPAWDITWSAGARFADVQWGHGAVATNGDSIPTDLTSYNTNMDFQGAGARVGLAGRRYFGCTGCFSLFAEGNLSVLVGDMDIEVVVTDELLDTTSALIRNSGRRVVPVTEVEAGASLQLGCFSRLSAGYFLSAWHDLGFRDTYHFPTQLGHFDDANILGFDGFFARLEVGF